MWRKLAFLVVVASRLVFMAWKRIYRAFFVWKKWIFVFFVAAALAAVPVVYYWWFAPAACDSTAPQGLHAYQFARVIAASLSVLVTAFVAGAALVQYHQNSLEKRIERSMAFWKRSNSKEHVEHWSEFLKYWIETDKQCSGDKTKIARAFVELAESNGGNPHDAKEHIEYVLDFYDEACAAVTMGACDEDAMFYYLGPFMVRISHVLRGFIAAWIERHHRPEKWDCFISLTAKWVDCLQRKTMPSGKPLPYAIPCPPDSANKGSAATAPILDSDDLAAPS